MSESLSEEPLPSSYGEVVDLLKKTVFHCVDPDFITTDNKDFAVVFDGTIRPFYLETRLARKIGLGASMSCRVMGSLEEGAGIALVVRTRGHFWQTPEGFYVAPVPLTAEGPSLLEPGRSYNVYHGPARWPTPLNAYFGHSLLDWPQMQLAEPPIAEGLIRAIQLHAQFKDQG